MCGIFNLIGMVMSIHSNAILLATNYYQSQSEHAECDTISRHNTPGYRQDLILSSVHLSCEKQFVMQIVCNRLRMTLVIPVVCGYLSRQQTPIASTIRNSEQSKAVLSIIKRTYHEKIELSGVLLRFKRGAGLEMLEMM